MKLDPNDIEIQCHEFHKVPGLKVGNGRHYVIAIHLPSGLAAACSQYQSQHKNRTKALDDLERTVIAAQITARWVDLEEPKP